MHVGLVILPTDRWPEARRQWEWADRSGFITAWTYDHIRWGGMPDGPWHAAVPVLAAAAGVTQRIKLGTLVATPNFRHPVALAREAITLDDLSGGRLELGLGPGSEGFDAAVLGQEPWPPAERLARFEEFLEVLRPILDGDASWRTTVRTAHYAAVEAPSTPGTLQRPLPLTVAAGGPKGLGLAVTHGRHWVTIGPTGRGTRTPQAILEAVRRQRGELDAACAAAGRAVSSVGKVLLWTPTEPVIDSVEQFDELAAPYMELGFDQIVLHHPAQTGPYTGDLTTFEEIAARHAKD
ncbi:MAG TPA: LLM class flavin-dependent oxidoreductase [Acidimicrobiales bacterium]|jgi:alkanesulfonate monooxygenase SsuD/methylene tetrahydromethanopterin reductase-like flavin-dependent oxidoreductase (luciferase family)|nr:LLM class flavin-dependent oxidoreductase [Acidimicrobiales bacterium]